MKFGNEGNQMSIIFRVWGCLAYYKNMDPKRTKLGPRGINCAFVGYSSNSKAYRLLNLEMNFLIESMYVEFFENVLTTRNSQNETYVDVQTSKESQGNISTRDVESEPRRSKRIRKEKR